MYWVKFQRVIICFCRYNNAGMIQLHKGTFLGHTVYHTIVCHARFTIPLCVTHELLTRSCAIWFFCYLQITWSQLVTRSKHTVVWHLLKYLYFDSHDLNKLHDLDTQLCISMLYDLSLSHGRVTSILYFLSLSCEMFQFSPCLILNLF